MNRIRIHSSKALLAVVFSIALLTLTVAAGKGSFGGVELNVSTTK